MNEPHVRQWTTVLRSTPSPQVTGTLVDEVVDTSGHLVPGFCCLGIGQKVAGIPLNHSEDPDPDEGERRWQFTEGDDLPSERFLRWLGVDRVEGFGDSDVDVDWPVELVDREGYPYLASNVSPGGGLTCASLNDTTKLTFAQIADVVDYFGVR